jgi:DNA transposition AAA+ family ATPase
MTLEQKQKLVADAAKYIADNKLSQRVFANSAGINPGYLNQMLNGKTTTKAGDKEVEIADKYFVKLGEAIGSKPNDAVWGVLKTPQYKQISFELITAKETGSTRTIIGETGCGKTMVTDLFVKKYPQYTYRITASRMHNLTDIINELLHAMAIPELGSKASRMKKMIEFLKDIKHNGGNPCIIIDESENIKTPVFGLLKGLYDGVKNYCSITMIGTPELITKIESMKRREKDGMPQFYRRFKAGVRRIESIDKRFPEFMEKYVSDKGVARMLLDMCENYGELNDYLEPALKEAQRLGEPLTEDLFRKIYNLPKY